MVVTWQPFHNFDNMLFRTVKKLLSSKEGLTVYRIIMLLIERALCT